MIVKMDEEMEEVTNNIIRKYSKVLAKNYTSRCETRTLLKYKQNVGS